MPHTEMRKFSEVKKDLKKKIKEMEVLVEEFSQLRFELLYLGDAGNKLAEKNYSGWTREVHNNLARALELADEN